MEKPIVTAILSYGMSGKVFHGPLLAANPAYRVKSVWERSSEKSKADFPDVQIVRHLDDILKDPVIELVVVNTPNPTHYDYCRQALMAGKHVVIEKPFTNTVDEGTELIRLAAENKVTLSVFQSRRYDSDFKTVQKVVAGGVLGQLVEYEAHYDRFRNYVEENTWKEERGPGSGILYNLGSHMIDQVLVLFGMPESVYADIRIQRPGSTVDDNYEVVMDYRSLKATVKSGYLVREQGPRYMLHGVEGSFIKSGIDPQEQALKDGIKPGTNGWGIEPESDQGIINTRLNGLHIRGKVETETGNYLEFYEKLHHSIRQGAPAPVTGEEGLNVIRVIEAAIESSQSQKRVYLSRA